MAEPPAADGLTVPFDRIPTIGPVRLDLHRSQRVAPEGGAHRTPTPGLRLVPQTPHQLAASALRRARCAAGLSQATIADVTGAHERTVRRREKGQVDLGLLEEALRCPAFARALGRELVAAADRLDPSPVHEVEDDLQEAA